MFSCTLIWLSKRTTSSRPKFLKPLLSAVPWGTAKFQALSQISEVPAVLAGTAHLSGKETMTMIDKIEHTVDMRQLDAGEVETVSGGFWAQLAAGLIVAGATWAMNSYELDTDTVDKVGKEIWKDANPL
jgi:hypothetical protein